MAVVLFQWAPGSCVNMISLSYLSHQLNAWRSLEYTVQSAGQLQQLNMSMTGTHSRFRHWRDANCQTFRTMPVTVCRAMLVIKSMRSFIHKPAQSGWNFNNWDLRFDTHLVDSPVICCIRRFSANVTEAQIVTLSGKPRSLEGRFCVPKPSNWLPLIWSKRPTVGPTIEIQGSQWPHCCVDSESSVKAWKRILSVGLSLCGINIQPSLSTRVLVEAAQSKWAERSVSILALGIRAKSVSWKRCSWWKPNQFYNLFTCRNVKWR